VIVIKDKDIIFKIDFIYILNNFIIIFTIMKLENILLIIIFGLLFLAGITMIYSGCLNILNKQGNVSEPKVIPVSGDIESN